MIGDLETAIRTKARARVTSQVNALFQALSTFAPQGFAGQQSGIPGQTNGDLVRVLKTNLIDAAAPLAEQQLVNKVASEVQA